MSKLYGRDREWASVLRFLSAPGGLLAIDGPPCAGKSSLLAESAAAARDRGYAVHLVPDGRVAESTAVTDVLRRAHHDGPRPLLAIDHAHRASSDVLDLLPRLREHRVTALIGLTGGHAPGDLRRALSDHGEVLTLGPVDADVVGRMLRDMLGATPRPDLAALVESAGGDPRMIAEIVTGLREEGRLDTRDGTAGVLGDGLPERVTGLVRGRVDVLTAKASQLLRVAAVLGRSFPVSEVAAMLGETTAALLLSVDEVIASGLVVAVDERLEFGSDVVRRAVLDSIPESVRHGLRHDAAVLRTTPRDTADVSEDVRAASVHGPSVGGSEVRGMSDGDRPAADQGVGWSAEAQGTVAAGVPDGDRGASVVRRVRALAVSGRLGAAIALARDSLARPMHAAPAAELRTALAGILLADGRPADAVAELEQALASPTAPEPLRRLAAAGRLLCLYFATGSQAGAHALSVLNARDREASDADVVMAATVHSCLEWNAGNLAEGMYWGRESTRWELDAPTAWWQSHAAVAYALKLAALGEFADAEDLVRGNGPDTEEAVTSGAPAARMIARARVMTQAGRLVQARIAAQSGLTTARDRGLRLLVPLASTVLATVALHRGDVPAAAEHVRRYRGDLAGGEAVLHSGQYDWVELLLAHARSGPERASELARERMADLPAARRMLIEEPGAAAWLVRQSLAIDDTALATAVVTAAESLAAGNPGFASPATAATHARALLDHDENTLLTVVARHRHPWAKANANEDLASLLTETGHPDRAGTYLAEAMRLFQQIGATGETTRLRHRFGIRPTSATAGAPAAPDTRDWQRLSEPERDIARLVGAGLTNRQVARRLFLSPHTVNYHLRAIFRKLGISSRVELARLAHEQPRAEV